MDRAQLNPDPREVFQIPHGEHYLNCAFMAPLPRPVEEAGIRGIRRKSAPWEMGPQDFFSDADALRPAFARLLGADSGDGAGGAGGSAQGSASQTTVPDPDRVAILPSVSYGVAICARNAGIRAGDRVVVVRDQFPGNVYGWMRAANDVGAHLHIVEPPQPAPGPGRGAAWNARILEAITPETRVVTLGHVHWADGTQFDLEAIGARARAVDALLVVDGTQSLGALPFPFERIQPDAVITATYKWLLGPYSAALGWFGPAFDGGTPLEETWIARRGSRDFGGLVHYRDDYDPGAVRFDVGQRSNFILLPMILEALRLLEAWGGAATVQAYARGITAPFARWAREAGLGIDDPEARAHHLFGVGLPTGVDRGEVAATLKARHITVSVRGEALRISPHLYNDAGDLEVLADALRSVL
jgi:selenocysteine lyase/cysteine desulfurase